MYLFIRLKRQKPHLIFITEEPVKAGDKIFVVDFLFREKRLIVEVDGERVHNWSATKRWKTERKREMLQAAGYYVLNYSDSLMNCNDVDLVLKEIEEAYFRKTAKQ